MMMKKKYFVLLMLFLAIGQLVNSQVIRFVTTAGAGDKDGTSWANAYDGTQLQTAINEATVTQVWVATGTYKPVVPAIQGSPNATELAVSFILINGVSVYGGFTGASAPSETVSNRPWATNPTILSGDIDGNGTLDAGNSHHVIYNDGAINSATILDGFTITKGNANAATPHHQGGGVCLKGGASPTISNCTITGNGANFTGGQGGGIYIGSSSPTINNCSISSNKSVTGGGGYINSSTVIINDCTISTNEATNSLSGTTSSQGGGLYITTSPAVTINNCTISGNRAEALSPSEALYSFGGGIVFKDGVALNVNNSIFSNNYGQKGGGAVTSFAQVAAVNQAFNFTNCNFYGNETFLTSGTNNGGAMYIATGQGAFVVNTNLNLTNCLFSRNKGYNGAAIFLYPNTNVATLNAKIVNCTLSGNQAKQTSGGIFLNVAVTATNNNILVNNTIIRDNTSGTASGKQVSSSNGARFTFNYSNFNGFASGTTDALFAGTSANPTINNCIASDPTFVDPVTFDYKLQTSSLCRDGGSNALYDAITPPPPTTDIRGTGYPRKTGTIDMGAYEYGNFWTGTTSTEWTTATNWSMGTAPTSTDALVIPSATNNPVIGTAESCKSLTINPGGALSVSTGKSLAVTDALLIKSDGSGTGSLINQGNVSAGTTTAERYMTADAWHQVSSPVVQDIANFLSNNAAVPTNTVPEPDVRGMMEFDAANNAWSGHFTNANATSTSAGKGYMLRTSSNTAVSFTGILNWSNVNVAVTRTASTPFDNGWNCIGNPYPSALDISAFFTANSALLDGSHNFIYVWDESQDPDNYTFHNAGTSPFNPQSGQGFFVYPLANSNISFTPAMQTHANTVQLKSAKTNVPEIKLLANSGSKKSSTLIKFMEGANKGLDIGLDAGILKADPKFALFTRLVQDNGIEFMQQVLPTNSYNSLDIPVGVDFASGGELVLSAQTIDLPADCKVILEDKVAKTFTDLKTGSYTVTLPANIAGSDRFVLHTSNLTTKADVSLMDNLSAYVSNTEIKVMGTLSSKASASLHDLQGRLLLNRTLDAGNSNSILLPSNTNGVYLLMVKDNGQVKSFKLAVSK